MLTIILSGENWMSLKLFGFELQIKICAIEK